VGEDAPDLSLIERLRQQIVGAQVEHLGPEPVVSERWVTMTAGKTPTSKVSFRTSAQTPSGRRASVKMAPYEFSRSRRRVSSRLARGQDGVSSSAALL